MNDQTKQKLLDAALKLFSKNGYKATTTRAIAIEADLNELTLFRRFGTKENLFNEVMIQNNERVKEHFISIISIDQKFEDPNDFLKAYIREVEKFYLNNFEIFSLMVNEDYNEFDHDMGEFSLFMGEFLKKNIRSDKFDHLALGIMINTFFYMINLSKYQGRTYMGEDSTEKFIDNVLLCME